MSRYTRGSKNIENMRCTVHPSYGSAVIASNCKICHFVNRSERSHSINWNTWNTIEAWIFNTSLVGEIILILQHVEVFARLGFGVPGPNPPQQTPDFETCRQTSAPLLPRGTLGTGCATSTPRTTTPFPYKQKSLIELSFFFQICIKFTCCVLDVLVLVVFDSKVPLIIHRHYDWCQMTFRWICNRSWSPGFYPLKKFWIVIATEREARWLKVTSELYTFGRDDSAPD